MRISAFPHTAALGLAGLASTISALATYSPSPSYAVGIPSGSTISSSTAGTIYVQISAPTTYQWAGLGIGSQMQGATILVMYADGNGNVTVSARDGGQGHVEPQENASLQAGITLLEGSGIVNGKMVANFKCTTCKLHSAASSTSSPFICAWNIGSSISSTSASATIFQHQLDNTRQFTFDLTSATLSSDSNPFLSSTSTTTSGGDGDGDSDDSGDGDGDDDDSGSATVQGVSVKTITNYETAHGTIMGVTVVLIFPLAAIFMRLGGNMWIHAIIQIFGLACLAAGLGIGVKLAQDTNQLYKPTGSRAFTHTVLGTTIVALFYIQPFLGLWHHFQYRRTQARAPVSWAHIWYGRALMVLGMVNGGLGLQLAANSNKGKIAYGVLAGVVGLTYIILVIFKRKGTGSRGVENGNGYGRRKGNRAKMETSGDRSPTS